VGYGHEARKAKHPCAPEFIAQQTSLMPIEYVRDPGRGWLLTTANGLVTFHDINEHLNVEEYNRDLGRPELIDARGAITNLTADQIRRLAQRAADTVSRVPLGPTAIVTTNDFVFGMARMYSAFAERAPARVEVFREMDAADVWLQGEGQSKV
jgi:hypothetical protein